jgi:hypothetical protein
MMHDLMAFDGSGRFAKVIEGTRDVTSNLRIPLGESRSSAVTSNHAVVQGCDPSANLLVPVGGNDRSAQCLSLDAGDVVHFSIGLAQIRSSSESLAAATTR